MNVFNSLLIVTAGLYIVHDQSKVHVDLS
jgi:hypothetical protein